MQGKVDQGRWFAYAMAALGLAAFLSLVSLFWFRSRRPADSLRQGLEAYARGDWQAASNLARERLKLTSTDGAALRLLARSSVRLGRDSSAMSLYEQLGSDAMAADDLHLLGVALARNGNSKGSVEVWERGLRADPDHPATLYEMIQVHLRADRFNAAAAAAGRLANHPDWQDRADALLGQIEFNRDHPEKAVERWERVLAHESEVPGNKSPRR